MAEKQYYLTEEGLQSVKKELSDLKNIRREKLKNDAPEAFHSEDLNPDYLSFRKDMGLLESRIAKLEDVLRYVQLIKNPPKNCKEIRIGAYVTVEVNGKVNHFKIVGTIEADPYLNNISNESPVGRALLGAREGDKITLPNSTQTVYKIKKIDYSKRT